MKQISLIIFDLHGVILRGDYWTTARKMNHDYGVGVKEAHSALYEQHCLAAIRKIPGSQVFPRAIKHLGLDVDFDEIWEYHLNVTSRRNESVIAYAQVLRRKGFKVIGLSKSFPLLFKQNIKRSGIAEKQELDAIINSYDLKLPKASKETMFAVMNRFGIIDPHTVIYIDDQKENLSEAKKFGVNTILYSTFSQVKKDVLRLV